MKIAFLNIYQGAIDRGAETFIKELSSRLERQNKIEIIAGNQRPQKRWPILWRLFIDPPGLAVLIFTLKNLGKIWKEKYQVVIPINGGWQPAIVRLITWLYGGKMVISGQSGVGWDDRNNLWCFPNCFTALSSFAFSWARKANPLVKIEYIPNGVDTQKFTPPGEPLPTKLKEPIVLCVGALTKSKRIDLVIKAVAKMGKASLLIVGDGELKEELENLGKKLLNNRFQLIKVPYDEMPKAYRVADVFTLSSESYQSFEVVLTEAMATNLPVVANNDPIRKEIVGEAGILINPANINKYAETLKKALKIDWGEKPREQAEKFSWDKIVKRYEELFKSLV